MTGFTIRLALPLRYYNGLEAIDLCRKYGLPESACVRLNGSTLFTVEDEGFLRAWFPKDAIEQSKIVQLDWLIPGEVYIHNGDIDLVKSSEFTPERMKELFVRAKFDSLVSELAKAHHALAEAKETTEDDQEEA